MEGKTTVRDKNLSRISPGSRARAIEVRKLVVPGIMTAIAILVTLGIYVAIKTQTSRLEPFHGEFTVQRPHVTKSQEVLKPKSISVIPDGERVRFSRPAVKIESEPISFPGDVYEEEPEITELGLSVTVNENKLFAPERFYEETTTRREPGARISLRNEGSVPIVGGNCNRVYNFLSLVKCQILKNQKERKEYTPMSKNAKRHVELSSNDLGFNLEELQG